jgi:hypothetical protein
VVSRSSDGVAEILRNAGYDPYVMRQNVSIGMSLEAKASAVIATLVASILCSAAVLAQAPARHPGRIVGNIDGISRDGDHFFISGWACQQGQTKSIAVQLFADRTTNGQTKPTPILAETANLPSEPAVAQACQDRDGGRHRFIIVLPYGYGPDSKLYVHGLRVVDGVPNDLLGGSGSALPRLPGLGVLHGPLPRLAGSYRGLSEHPGVFVTAAELKDLAARINRPGSYSMERFGQLAAQVKRDLDSGIDWDVTYSGADGGIYQYAFSYEPQDHHEAQIRAALKLAPDAKAPAGAAIVGARLALYSAVVKAGATPSSGAPSANAAAALAKRILLAWADHGFREASGRFMTLGSFTRDGHGRPDSGLGLVLGRGVVYSVHAQDLLQSVNALNGDEARRLDALHGALFDLMRQSENVFFAGVGFPYSECSRYTNIATNAVVAMLATARLLNDEGKFNAVLYGNDPSIPILVSWMQLFDHVIYGQSEGPSPECVNNHEADSLTSLNNHHDYQTATAVPGEIADRFRNSNPLQGIGYPMFTLERLIDSAEIMRNAGLDPYGYRGAHRQSIETAMQYYACFAKGAGFYKVVTVENAGACPNAAQYYGKLVNGVDRNMVMGAYRFPADEAITEVEAAAKTAAASGPFSLDAIFFGKWRD